MRLFVGGLKETKRFIGVLIAHADLVLSLDSKFTLSHAFRIVCHALFLLLSMLNAQSRNIDKKNELGVVHMKIKANLTKTLYSGKKTVLFSAVISAISASSFALAEDGENPSAMLDEVVVTGSRIARSGFQTPTPTTVIGDDAIEISGFNNIGDIALRTPSFGIGLGSANANFSDDAGASFVNLRGLGADRTLVLVNGRRRVSGSTLSSAVDLSTIPAGMVERIEVITGGASAVYGADAVTGVMNVILKDDFDGFEVSANGGFGTEGSGGETFAANMFGGAEFADDKGGINFGLSYSKEEPLFGPQRDFTKGLSFVFANGANTGPNDGIPDNIHYHNSRLPGTHGAGTFVIDGNQYTVDPNLRLVQNDQTYPVGFIASGGDGYDPALYTPLRTEAETVSAMTTVKYELSDNVDLFVEAQFSMIDVVDARNPSSFDNSMIIDRANPFIPADVAALMDVNGLTELNMQRGHNDHGLEINNLDKKNFSFVGGFDGQIIDEWNWSAFFQYGQYDYNSQMENTRINSRFSEAIDVISDPITGDPICSSASARANGCEPLNVIGADVATQEALDYILHTRLRDVQNSQKVIGLQFDGSPLELPAGPMQIAGGYEYRKETISIRDDGLALSGDLFFTVGVGTPDTDSSFDVNEVFIEILAPLVADKKLIDEMNLELAFRSSDYSTIGKTTAWKAGGDWSLIEGFRLRATRSKSVRAPNLNELFGAGSASFQSLIDPCHITNINDNANRAANCLADGAPVGYFDPSIAASDPIFTGGNVDLDPETSNSWTIGFVLTPAILNSVSVSVDYWDIEITDAINTVDPQSAFEKCYDSESLDNPFCSLIERGPDFAISRVNLSDINIGKLTAKGVDIQVDYRTEMFDGDFSLSALGTYLLEHEELGDVNDPATLIIRDGEVSHPAVRLNLTAAYKQGPWSIDLMTRYIGSAKADVQAGPEERDLNRAKAKIYNDLVIGYNFSENYRAHIGVNNLFDVTPPNLAETQFGGSFLSEGALYDNIGRFITMGVSAKF